VKPAPPAAVPKSVEVARPVGVAASPAAKPGATPAVAIEHPPIDPAPVIAAGGAVLRFKFRGNSWVEIKDGRGKLLLSRNNPGGSEAEVMGRPPFAIVVGNATEVQMFYNNREFDLEPHTRVAVARFTVE
jgi:cytoskeleton protein RodZ